MNWTNFFTRKSGSWLWFFLTFVASLIPVILRFMVWLETDINPFDFKDFLFAGLAMNLSNLNLVGSKDFDARLPIILISCFLILLITARLGLLLGAEGTHSNEVHILANCFTIILVGGSIFLSHSANKYIFDTVN